VNYSSYEEAKEALNLTVHVGGQPLKLKMANTPRILRRQRML